MSLFAPCSTFAAVGFEMGVGFAAAGAGFTSGANTFVDITGPACAIDDILLAVVTNRVSTDVVGPGGLWNVEITSNGGNGRAYLFWRRAIAGDSGATWTWTRASNSSVPLNGQISAWRGCKKSGSPFIGACVPHYNTSSNANINYDSYTPGVPCLVVALGYYSVTGAGPASFAIAGTDPTLSNHFLVKNSSNWFGYSGMSTGGPTGARSNDGTDGTSNISTGILLGLEAATPVPVMSYHYRRRRAD